jgi:tryptophanyl-tRNA synthetase
MSQASERVRVLSGIQPSGVVHLGNYLGAIQRWAADQDTKDAYYMVADLHALTLSYDPATLQERSRETLAALVACGLRTNIVVLFVQSHVQHHTALYWLLANITPIGDLRRMTHFKEKAAAERETTNAALFAYPVLQAADVLLYQAREVPVGEDQRQHLELVSDIARRFNNTFGYTFAVPRGVIPPSAARVMDLQEPMAKMSKSAGSDLGVILLSDSDAAIMHKCRLATTDGEQHVDRCRQGPGLTNLMSIYGSLTDRAYDDVVERFAGIAAAEVKEIVANQICATLGPKREKYNALLQDRASLDEIIEAGAVRATQVASETLSAVRSAMGLAA